MTKSNGGFGDYVKEWFHCIMRGKHEPSEEAEDKLYEDGLGFYITTCERCGINLRLETKTEDEYLIIEVDSE